MKQIAEKVLSTSKVCKNISNLHPLVKFLLLCCIISAFYHALLQTFWHLQTSACGQFVTNFRSDSNHSTSVILYL